MRFRKCMAFLLALAMVITTFSFNPTKVSAAGADPEALAKVVTNVKKVLDIKDEYTNFNYEYHENYDFYQASEMIWDLEWSNADYTNTLSVTCDDEGKIQYMNRHIGEEENTAPTQTVDELYDVAFGYIKKLNPEIANKLVKSFAYGTLYSSSYYYGFNRIENGIEMPDNSVYVAVSYVSKQLTSYNIYWNYDIEIPAPKDLVSREKLIEGIDEAVDMKLQYCRNYMDGNGDNTFLAYVPTDSYLSFDAKTGKLLDNETAPAAANGMVEEDEAMGTAGYYDTNYLTDEEIAKISKLNDLISGDKAVSIVLNNDKLYHDAKATTINKTLAGMVDGEFVWDISFRDDRPFDDSEDYFRAYESATVDAKTGEIRSYYSNIKGLYDYTEDELKSLKINYSKKQCRKVLAAFIKSNTPELYAEAKFEGIIKSHPIKYNYVKDKYSYAGYYITFGRQHNGIYVEGDSITGSVDALTGKIYSYDSYWNKNTVFPETEIVLSEKEAFAKYVALDGLDLKYQLVSAYDENYVFTTRCRLAYTTGMYPELIDPKTGKQLYYDGKEYEKQTNVFFEYSDIENSKYKRVAEILGSLNIGFSGSKLQASKVVTADEFREMLENIPAVYTHYNAKAELTGTVTREKAAKYIADRLELGAIAALDIYKISYADAADISKDCKGSVAIMSGLGIMKEVVDNKFNPQHGLTRGEALEIAYKLISYK